MTSTLPKGVTAMQSVREGEMLSRYVLLEQIGRGGQADVWSAWDSQMQCVVVIKLIHTQKISVTASRQFTREAHLFSRLQHPHIVPLYDYGEMMSLRFLVMRFMSGGSMSTLVRKGALTPPEVARLSLALAQTLDFIHAQSIVHRDLKPANVLLDSRREPYLADFGIARELGVTSTLVLNTPEGTVPYMSPEQLNSEAVNYQSDLYSFGIMLFEMLTGQLPYEGRFIQAVQQRQSGELLQDPAEIIPSLPGGLVAILRQLTSLEPAQRPANCIEPILRLITLLGSDAPIEVIAPPSVAEDIEPRPLTIEDVRPDAVYMLTALAQTWTPTQGQSLTLTDYKYLTLACPDQGSLQSLSTPRASQILLYGSLRYQPSDQQVVDLYWQASSEAMRREVCWSVLAEAGTAPLTPTIERTLMLAKTLPQPAEVPPNVTEALMTVLRSTVTNNTSVAVSTEALKLLFGGQPTVSDSWRETDPVAASLLADLVSQKTPLAEEALGYIARIRSANAVRRLLAQTDRPQQLRSLAIFWDKAGSLPGGVLPATQYVSALIWIGARQLIERPLWLLADYGAIAFGCGLALALFIYLTFRSPDFLSSRRIQNAIAIGLEFGVQLGVSGLVAYALAERLRIVSLAVRIITGTLVGGSVATLVFANFHHLYYDLPPQSPLLFPGALAFVAGFALAGPIRHIPIRVFLISLGVLVGVMATWYAYLNSGDDPLLYLYEDAVLSSWLIAILIAATIGIVSQFAAYANRRSTLSRMGIPKKFIKNSHL